MAIRLISFLYKTFWRTYLEKTYFKERRMCKMGRNIRLLKEFDLFVEFYFKFIVPLCNFKSLEFIKLFYPRYKMGWCYWFHLIYYLHIIYPSPKFLFLNCETNSCIEGLSKSKNSQITVTPKNSLLDPPHPSHISTTLHFTKKAKKTFFLFS